MQHQKLQTSTFNQEQSFFLAFLLMSARQFPIDPCNPRPHRVATTGHHEPATADPFRCSLSLSEICWESQWSGCFGMFSTCICQAKDDKTAFLNCLNYLILGSRQTKTGLWIPGTSTELQVIRNLPIPVNIQSFTSRNDLTHLAQLDISRSHYCCNML